MKSWDEADLAQAGGAVGTVTVDVDSGDEACCVERYISPPLSSRAKESRMIVPEVLKSRGSYMRSGDLPKFMCGARILSVAHHTERACVPHPAPSDPCCPGLLALSGEDRQPPVAELCFKSPPAQAGLPSCCGLALLSFSLRSLWSPISRSQSQQGQFCVHSGH